MIRLSAQETLTEDQSLLNLFVKQLLTNCIRLSCSTNKREKKV